MINVIEETLEIIGWICIISGGVSVDCLRSLCVTDGWQHNYTELQDMPWC